LSAGYCQTCGFRFSLRHTKSLCRHSLRALAAADEE
jgi:ribosomal protein S14